MIWIDFFAQVFVHALAWCLAFFIAAGLVGWGVWTMVSVFTGERP